MRGVVISLSSLWLCIALADLVQSDEKLPPAVPPATKAVTAPDKTLPVAKPTVPVNNGEVKPPKPEKSDAPVVTPAPPTPAPVKTPPGPVVPADPAQIAKWIAELSDDRFEVREAATVKLCDAGAAAVEPLIRACEGNSLEVASRAIRALRTLYMNADEAIYAPAEAALNKLATSTNRGVARRAVGAIAQPVAIQQQRVLKKIESLGGIVTYQMTPNGIALGQFGEPLVVDIRLDESWNGGDAGLNNIRKLSGLGKLYVIEGSTVTPAAVESLHADLPTLQIERRGRALLGVEGTTTEGLCIIRGVSEDGAAAKAGIKSGDVIIKYDGVELKDFLELIEITKKKKAGDKIAVEVLRQDPNGAKVERIRMDVTLGGWRSTSLGRIRRTP